MVDCGVYVLEYTERFLRDFVVTPAVASKAAAAAPVPAQATVSLVDQEAVVAAAAAASAAADTVALCQKLGPQWFSATRVQDKRHEIEALVISLNVEWRRCSAALNPTSADAGTSPPADLAVEAGAAAGAAEGAAMGAVTGCADANSVLGKRGPLP